MRDRKSTHRGRVFSLSQRLNRWLFGIKRRRCSLHLTSFSLSPLSLSLTIISITQARSSPAGPRPLSSPRRSKVSGQVKEREFDLIGRASSLVERRLRRQTERGLERERGDEHHSSISLPLSLSFALACSLARALFVFAFLSLESELDPPLSIPKASRWAEAAKPLSRKEKVRATRSLALSFPLMFFFQFVEKKKKAFSLSLLSRRPCELDKASPSLILGSLMRAPRDLDPGRA
jgi:hypothetical protein